MSEIVALKFGSRIVFDREECFIRVKAGEPFEFVSRDVMKLMAAADLGPNWTRGAQAPTLFTTEQLEEKT